MEGHAENEIMIDGVPLLAVIDTLTERGKMEFDLALQKVKVNRLLASNASLEEQVQALMNGAKREVPDPDAHLNR